MIKYTEDKAGNIYFYQPIPTNDIQLQKVSFSENTSMISYYDLMNSDNIPQYIKRMIPFELVREMFEQGRKNDCETPYLGGDFVHTQWHNVK